MAKGDQQRIRELIERLGRISAADEWANDVNPTQWTALSYLARANRFSRSPSHVADFMVATRGTVSQTLKSLARKGLIAEIRSEQDRRSISYSVTEKGAKLLERRSAIEAAIGAIGDEMAISLLAGLETLARAALRERGYKRFGVCQTCIHHRSSPAGAYCQLLNLPLAPAETQQLCHEHA